MLKYWFSIWFLLILIRFKRIKITKTGTLNVTLLDLSCVWSYHRVNDLSLLLFFAFYFEILYFFIKLTLKNVFDFWILMLFCMYFKITNLASLHHFAVCSHLFKFIWSRCSRRNYAPWFIQVSFFLISKIVKKQPQTKGENEKNQGKTLIF